MIRDVQLDSEVLLELVKAFGLLVGDLVCLHRFLKLLFLVVWSRRQLLVALFLGDVCRYLHLGANVVLVFLLLAIKVKLVRIVLIPCRLELIRRWSRFHSGWLRLPHLASFFQGLVGNFWYQEDRLDWWDGVRTRAGSILALCILVLG